MNRNNSNSLPMGLIGSIFLDVLRSMVVSAHVHSREQACRLLIRIHTMGRIFGTLIHLSHSHQSAQFGAWLPLSLHARLLYAQRLQQRVSHRWRFYEKSYIPTTLLEAHQPMHTSSLIVWSSGVFLLTLLATFTCPLD